jgi:hypothetical protein
VAVQVLEELAAAALFGVHGAAVTRILARAAELDCERVTACEQASMPGAAEI